MSENIDKITTILKDATNQTKQSLSKEAYEHVLNLSIAILHRNQHDINHIMKELTTTMIALNK